MSLLKSISSVAAKVISDLGTTILVVRDTQDGYDPATGAVTSGKYRFSTKAVIETVKRDSQNGSVQAGDFKLILPSTGEVKTGDQVTFGSTTATVYRTNNIPLENGNAAFEAYARA